MVAEQKFEFWDCNCWLLRSVFFFERTIAGEPNNAEAFNLMHLPSDAIVAKSYGAAVSSNNAASGTVTLAAGKKYVVRGVETGDEVSLNDQNNAPSTYAIRTALDASELAITTSAGATVANTGSLASGNVIDVTTATTVIKQMDLERC